MRRPRLPLLVNILMIAAGALAVGARAATEVAPHQLEQALTVVQPASTVYSTRVVKRVIRGRIVHTRRKVYVVVPQIIIRTDGHTIRVPAHKLPLRSAAATVANPLVTVYVPLQGETVFVPTTVTTTETVQVPTTVTGTITVTVTVPINPTTSDQGGTTDGP